MTFNECINTFITLYTIDVNKIHVKYINNKIPFFINSYIFFFFVIMYYVKLFLMIQRILYEYDERDIQNI